MNEQLDDATAWLRHAREDLTVAQREHDRSDSVHRWVCFAAQQAAEKALKAICVYEQIEFPFTHNVERLRRLIPDTWAISDADVRLAVLTPWAVAGRYPADAPEASRNDARDALEIATAVVASVGADFEQLATEEDDEHVVNGVEADAEADNMGGNASTSGHEAG